MILVSPWSLFLLYIWSPAVVHYRILYTKMSFEWNVGSRKQVFGRPRDSSISSYSVIPMHFSYVLLFLLLFIFSFLLRSITSSVAQDRLTTSQIIVGHCWEQRIPLANPISNRLFLLDQTNVQHFFAKLKIKTANSWWWELSLSTAEASWSTGLTTHRSLSDLLIRRCIRWTDRQSKDDW